MIQVRKTLNKFENKIVSEYKRKEKQIDQLDDRVVRSGGTITYRHLRAVHENQWLDDDTVEVYLQLLQKKYPDVQMTNSFFIDRLMGVPKRTKVHDGKVICVETDVTASNQIPAELDKPPTKSKRKQMTCATHDKDKYNYKNVQRWSKKRPFHNARLFFCPINILNSHWVACAACAGDVAKLLVNNDGEVITCTLTH